MNPLGLRIARLVEAGGPMPLSDFMHLCLADPRHGYYPNRQAIGRLGDFVTAPEISQIFGELIGVWCVAAWAALGRPERLVLAEAGPGHGTLMADLLRTARKFPEFKLALDICLIETSPAMEERQRALLGPLHRCLTWRHSVAELPDGPLLFIANEFLDALPSRQFVKAGKAWRERCVGLSPDGKLAWVLGGAVIDPALLPSGHGEEPDGAAFEVAPARESAVRMLAERLNLSGGYGLVVDYGHAASGFGDTFQAVRAHKYVDPLDAPGQADLTAHVDFDSLRRVAMEAGTTASKVISQRDFLLAMGISARAAQLTDGAAPEIRRTVETAAARLTSPEAMGTLFKVIALAGSKPGAPPEFPPFLLPVSAS